MRPYISETIREIVAERAQFTCELTSEGLATLKILGMNHPDSMIERKLLIELGLFP